MKMEHLRKTAVTGLWTGFILMVLWGAGMLRMHLSQPALANAILYPPGNRTLPEFSLRDSNQEVFDNSRLSGKWSFLFFGYTRCPDVCPLTLQTLRWAADRIRRNDGEDNVRFVFISVDSTRDSAGYVLPGSSGEIPATTCSRY
jgi:protein SCO1/2